MNLIQRRKILKRANYLELIPIRLPAYKTEENGRVTLIIPKFRNEAFARWFIPKRKSTNYTLRLDELGSASWLAIDGIRNVGAIADILSERYQISGEDARIRLTRFITLLYDQRYITFTVLQDGIKR
jgi:hypothetical protein